MGACNPGLTDIKSLTVQQCHTASEDGSGDVAVLGTPTLLGLAEQACVAAICKDLPDGETSVGSWSEIEHLSPVPVGTEVCAEATLRGHHGSRLEFVVFIRCGDTTVAKVRHRRVLVNKARFSAKIERLTASVADA
jgi:fluoroacetyl-CoA thioesterase